MVGNESSEPEVGVGVVDVMLAESPESRRDQPPPDSVSPVVTDMMTRMVAAKHPNINLYEYVISQCEASRAISDYSDVGDCIITHEKITGYFYRCWKCHNPCSRDALKEWLTINSSCPMCRENYDIYPTLYVKANIVKEYLPLMVAAYAFTYLIYRCFRI
jgi:uncharacterized CHY-type Zn-finger protein